MLTKTDDIAAVYPPPQELLPVVTGRFLAHA